MSAIEVLANSKADHGLGPLEAGGVYVPVLCTSWVTVGTEILTADYFGFGGPTSQVGDVPSVGIPARGSARELLDLRCGSIG